MNRVRLALFVPALVLLATVPAAQAADRLTLPIGPESSRLSFTIHRPGETVEGTAADFNGEASFDPDHLEAGGSVTLRIKAASMQTGNNRRDRKMRETHLEVTRFPEIVFESTSIKVEPGGAGTQRKARVEGDFSLHGVTRAIIVPATIQYDNGRLTAEGSADLTYTAYKIPIPKFLWLVMDDAIKVRFHLVAGKPAR